MVLRGEEALLNKNEGAITVFFSITILAFIVFTAVIVEGSRIKIAELQGHRALEVSANSLLAGYNSLLKEEYGLFALANPDGDYLDKTVRTYFSGNTSDAEAYWRLYDHRLDSLEIALKDSLNEASVVKQQILQLMKYRGLESLGESMLDKLELISSTGGTLQILDNKLKLEREMQRLSNLQQQLKVLVETSAGFDGGESVRTLNDIQAEAFDILSIKASIRSVESDISDIRASLQGAPGSASEAVYEFLYQLSLSLQELNAEMAAKTNHIVEGFSSITTQLGAYLDVNREIQEIVQEIGLQRSAVNQEYQQYKNLMEASSKELQEEARKALEGELKTYEALLNPEELQQIKAVAINNEAILKQANAILTEIEQNTFRGIRENSPDVFGQRSIGTYANIIGGYNTSTSYSMPQLSGDEASESDLKDTRKEEAKGAKDIVEEAVSGKTVTISQEILNLLPSKGGHINDGKGQEIEFEEDKVNGGYTEESFSGFNAIVSGLKDFGIDLRDHLLINEYAIGTFKHYTSDMDKGTKSPTGQYKSSRQSYFDYEVEYILYGNTSQLQNVTEAKRDILLMRFVLNIVYIYTQPHLVNRAAVLAAAIAAPLGGAAMPIIKTMIIAGWAMGYAIEDANKLLKGDEVLLYRGNEAIKTDYQDYLRFFLLMRNSDSEMRLLRIMDLVQLNMHKKRDSGSEFFRADYYSGLTLNGEYSIKFLFMKLPLIQKQLGDLGNRYGFKKTVWTGY